MPSSSQTARRQPVRREMHNRELIATAQSGDLAALCYLLESSEPFIRLVTQKTVSAAWLEIAGWDLEDALQWARFAFLRAVVRFDLHHGAELTSFAGLVIANELRNQMRRAHPFPTYSLDAPIFDGEGYDGEARDRETTGWSETADLAPGPEAEAVGKVWLSACVQRAARTMDPVQRGAVEAWINGGSQQEIARGVGRSQTTISHWVSAFRGELREAMAEA